MRKLKRILMSLTTNGMLKGDKALSPGALECSRELKSCLDNFQKVLGFFENFRECLNY